MMCKLIGLSKQQVGLHFRVDEAIIDNYFLRRFTSKEGFDEYQILRK